jgi:hypothetical protein
LRAGLIAKRTPANRSREYIKKIKQARLKLTEGRGRNKSDDEEPKTPPKEAEKSSKHEDDEDFLDVDEKVNFEEDEDENMSKNDSTEKAKTPKKEKSPEKEKIDEAKSPSREPEKSHSIDLKCVHCFVNCSSLQVSQKSQR